MADDDKLPPPPPAPASLAPPPPPPRDPSATALPILDEVNARYRDLDVAQHHALLNGYLRYIERPRASVRAIWETERVGPEEDAPFIRDVTAWEFFQTHAMRLRWKVRRNDHWTEVRAAVERKIKDQQIQKTIDELGTLDAAEGALLEYILGDPSKGIEAVKPKSLEGAVSALVKLDERRDKKRTMVIEAAAAAAQDVDTEQTIVTADGGDPAMGALTSGGDGFSDAEIEAMAMAAAEHAVEDMTARLEGDNPEDAAEMRAELLRGDAPVTAGITPPEVKDDSQDAVSTDSEGDG